MNFDRVYLGRITSATAITGTENRWTYKVRRISVYPENIYSDPGGIFNSEQFEQNPALNLAEMENTANFTRGYADENIPDDFTIKEAEGMCLMFPVFMIFDTTANAEPEFGFLFFSINAIDGGCE